MPGFRPRLEGLQTCAHGGLDYAELAELGLRPDQVLDFSVNCNPFGPPPGVKAAADRACWDRLPDSQAFAFRKVLASFLGVDLQNIVAGNGSVELIRFMALAFFRPGDTVVVLQPTFGEYEASLLIAGAIPLTFTASATDGFAIDLDGVEAFLRHGARGLFLCNPNNPSGTYLSREAVERLLEALPDGLVILDEAYAPFVKDAWRSLDLMGRSNLVILRSMTKDYALGGLRLGYAVGPEPLLSILRRALPPWNVNVIAQEAGLLALDAPDYPAQCLEAILEARNYLQTELSALGLRVSPSSTNYFLVEVGDGAAFRRSLLRQGVLVRDCNSFGLPSYVRVSARTLRESERLVEAVRSVTRRGAGRP